MTSNASPEGRLKSYELLQKVIVEKGLAKQVPQNGTPAEPTVYGWSRPPGSQSGTGARNPLDMVKRLIEVADIEGKMEIANWVCFAANGFFIPSPGSQHENASKLFKHSNELIHAYATMVQTLVKTAEDGIIELHEAKEIRSVWDRIQSTTEWYVRQCENGEFDSEARKISRKNSRVQNSSGARSTSAA